MIISTARRSEATRRRGFVAALRVLALTAALAPAAGASAGAYELQPGDALEFWVAGAPGLERRLTVDVEGNVVAPLVGPLPAAGRSLAGFTEDLRAALAQVSYSVVAPSGELLTMQILPGAVTVSMAEYRPVYLDGDVRSPGAFAFAPGLTARRAIALAGGYGLAQLQGGDPVPLLLGAQADMRRFLAEATALEARIARIEGQLDSGSAEPVFAEAPDGSPAAALARLERDRLAASRRRTRELEAHYDAALTKVRRQIVTLEERLKGETEGVVADTEDFQRLLEAESRGTVPMSRLSDSRRTLLFSTTRELQTRSELNRAQMELGALAHERDRTRVEERVALLAELTEAKIALEAARVGATAAGRLARYLQGAVVDPESATDVSIIIARPDGERLRPRPDEDPPLRPGDLITVRIAAPPFQD